MTHSVTLNFPELPRDPLAGLRGPTSERRAGEEKKKKKKKNLLSHNTKTLL